MWNRLHNAGFESVNLKYISQDVLENFLAKLEVMDVLT